MNEKIRQMFPATEKYVYLNSAAVSPMPKITVEAVISQLTDVSENGSSNLDNWVRTKNRCRALVAEMLKTDYENIAFTRNTSDGFSTVANGIDWKKGDNIVTFEREFPSNFYPWRMVRDKFGVELKICPEKNGRYDLDEFLSLIDENTKLVAVSAVQFGSGYRADLEKIGKKVREFDALFAVDIIQAFGVVPLNLPKQLVDIACGASHKWLCSPEGSGIFYISERARKRIEPSLVGWISVEEPWDFTDYEQNWKPNALAWETGTGGSSLFYGLEQSLKLLNETGVENIQNYLEELSDYLCEKLKEKNYEIVSSRLVGEKSQIVCIMPKSDQTSQEVAKMLEKQGIIISPRGERLRIAPHFFNNKTDIDKLIEALP
ncbi:MAG: aminotransferase class V-fold PLP-dependent enzyme [Pyrinomonadaceae bacterium]|jgi:selenocysteine lyase/cysteine desulfurase|nr:aminotransferase class V-fold PLP-dependent enzyme [Pyrinomonadaceae bacterium]